MRKACFLLCIMAIVLLSGCRNDQGKAIDADNIFDKIRLVLALIPTEFEVAEAVKDGYFVVMHGDLKSKEAIMNTFVSDANNGKETSITIVQYTEEGDPIITRVVFDGTEYYGIEDDTRDEFSSSENRKNWEFSFKFLKVYEHEGNVNYYLVNDDQLTYDALMKSLISSKFSDRIPFQFLCRYNK